MDKKEALDLIYFNLTVEEVNKIPNKFWENK